MKDKIKDKLDKGVKRSKIFMYLTFGIGAIISTILSVHFYKKFFGSSKKIESVCDCPEELYTVPDDDDEDDNEDLEEL